MDRIPHYIRTYLYLYFTAKASPRDIATDLMKALEIGEQSYATLKDEKLDKHPPKKKCYDPMKMRKLKRRRT